jgi:hypothetical protein
VRRKRRCGLSDVRPAGTRYGFRGNELLMLMAAGFNARLTALESTLDAIA